MGWQPIGVQTYGGTAIAPAGTEQQAFAHVFANRAHTCLQAVITNTGVGENADTSNDRAQINWEVVYAGDNFSMPVPFANAAAEDIAVGPFRVGCLVNASVVPCFAVADDGSPNANEPQVIDAPSDLGANQEAIANVEMPEIPDGGMVVVVEADMGGQRNNVMIQVSEPETPARCARPALAPRRGQ